MLIRPDATFIDDATNRAERVFPRGTNWRTFRSHLPGAEVFANSVLDPSVGVGGGLALQTFATADWQNWVSSMQVGLFEIGTRIGVPPLKDTGLNKGMSLVYSHLGDTISAFQNFDDPVELVAELVKNTAMQVLQMIAQSNIVTATVAQVLAVAVWAVDVGRAQVEADLAKNVTLPPLQTDDPATDTWQVNRVFEVFRGRGTGGVIYPDGGIEPASNADYTSLFLPAYKSQQPWILQHRAKGLAAQQGHPQKARGPEGETQYSFDPGDASTFGFMPGTTTSLRVLQASYRFYYSVRGTPVDRYCLYCRGIDEPCYKSQKTFDGSRDCRQCVDAESVWPVQGLGWAYGGAPLNATTPGENVGAFYPSMNKLLGNLLDMIARPGPLLYTVNTERIYRQWKQCFELFWEFAAAEWRRHRGSGWKGLISRLVTLMTTFEDDGEVRLGGRDPDMPLNRINSPRVADFTIPFSRSIFNRIIAPYCRDLAAVQLHYLDTVSVAYIPPGAGALYSGNGNIRRNKLGDYFATARRELLASNKRVLVDLRQVSDPEYRAELEKAGVKASPVNKSLQGSPGVDGHKLLAPDLKPRRVPRKPKVARASPFEGAVKLAQFAPSKPRRVSSKHEKSPPKVSAEATAAQPSGNRGVALGAAAGGVLLTAAAIFQLRKMTDE